MNQTNVRGNGRVKVASAIFGAAALLGLAASSQAAPLVQVSGATNASELEWQVPGPQVDPGLGSTGNGDGALLENEGSPGLTLSQIPFDLSGNPGSKLETDGTTSFFDVTMQVLDLPAGPVALSSAGNAGMTTMPDVGYNVISQGLNGAVVRFLGTDPAGPDVPLLLLEATVAQAAIIGVEGATTASLQSSNVLYTDGVIYDSLVAQGGTLEGQMSWTLLLRAAGIVVRNPPAGPGPLAALSADASGLFNTPQVPEPASVALLLLVGATVLSRRRRRA